MFSASTRRLIGECWTSFARFFYYSSTDVDSVLAVDMIQILMGLCLLRTPMDAPVHVIPARAFVRHSIVSHQKRLSNAGYLLGGTGRSVSSIIFTLVFFLFILFLIFIFGLLI